MRPTRFLRLLAALPLLATMLVVAPPPSVVAEAACTTSNITITPLYDQIRMYVDPSPSPATNPMLRGHYIGYRFTNNTGCVLNGAWAKLDTFSGLPTTFLTLSTGQAASEQLGNLASGASGNLYWYVQSSVVKTTTVPTGAQSHVVHVYDRRPDLTGVTQYTSATESIAAIDADIQANDNSVNTVVSTSNPPNLGATMTETVTGNTGTIGSGDPNDANSPLIQMTPSAIAPGDGVAGWSAWDPSVFELESVDINVDLTTSGGSTTTDNYDYLFRQFSAAASKARNYTITYIFVIVNTSSANISTSPIQVISSGTQNKHTDMSSWTATSIQPIAPVANAVSVAKSCTPNAITSNTATNVTCTITATNGSATQAATLNDFTDTMPSTATYGAGTSLFNGAATADPSVSGSTLVWVGPWAVPAGGSSTLRYTMSVNSPAGTQTNSVVGHIGVVTIGTTSTSSTPATSAITVSNPKTATSFTQAATANPITYGQSSTLSESGLPAGATGTVTFTSGATTLCTVTLPATGCTTGTSLPAGSYPLTATYSGDGNYLGSTATNSVTLTVNRTPLTITASSPGMTYGGAVPAIAAAYSGFVNGETSSALTTAPTCSTTATTTSPVGSYPSSCSGAVDANYTISYASGSVAVSRAALTITASSPSMTYGGAVPAITPGYTGFVAGDSSASLSTAPACSTTALATSSAGSYPSSCSGAVDGNYTISYVAGSVAVTKAPLSITASSASMTYGGAVPGVTPTYAGFVNGDSATSLSTAPSCSTTATSAKPAGTYPSTCAGGAAANYAISYVSGTITVTPAPLTVSASSASMVYGGSVPTITATYGGFVNGDTAASLTTAPSCTTVAATTSPVGSYGSSCSGAVDANYTISYAAGSVSVTKAPLTITASSATMPYKGSVPAITASYGGFVNGDNASSLTTAPACSTAATTTSDAGSYGSSCSSAAAANYAISYVAGTVTVTAIPTTTGVVSSLNPSAFGDNVTFTATVTGGVPNGGTVTFKNGATTLGSGTTSGGVATYTTPTLPIGSGQTITAAYAGNIDYLVSSGTTSQTVGSAASTPTSFTEAATPNPITYGQQSTLSESGLPGPATGTVTFSSGTATLCTATLPTTNCLTSATLSAGSYPITAIYSGDLTYLGSTAGNTVTLVVNPAPLTITASSASLTYGGAVPPITAGYSGFVNGESSSSLTTAPGCSTPATSGSPAGTYGSTCSGAADANYTISYLPGTVTIAKAPLTITALSPSMTYGGALPAITASYGGFVNGDSASSLTTAPTCSTLATPASAVGTYGSSCSGAADPNYTMSYVAGVVTVTAAPLTITASSTTMTYGGLVPMITASYGGFVNGDTATSLTTAPSCATSATSGSSAGNYASSCSGAGDANYSISYVPGNVTIAPAPLTITASSPATVYGGTVPAITPSYSGFVNGDSTASLTTAPSCATSAASTSTVGGYPSTCSGATGPNYSISYTPGTVTVTAASLTITASSRSMTYGGAVPTITPSYSGFVNGDTASSLTTAPSCSTTATSASTAGSYPSTCSGAADSNYAIAYVAGTVTVLPPGAPVAAPHGGTLVVSTTLTIPAPGLLSGATGSGTITVTANSSPSHGTVSVNSDGSYSYTPTPGYSGPDSFTYTITDGSGQTATATVSIAVTPLAQPTGGTILAGTGPLTLTPPAPSGTGPFTYALAGTLPPASVGTVTIDPLTGAITFIPAPGFTGPVPPFTYSVTDAAGGTATATVRIVVRPQAADYTTTVINTGTAVSFALPTPVATAPLTCQLVAASLPSASIGTFTVNAQTCVVSFTPGPGYTGNVPAVQYTVTDASGTVSAPATINVAVLAAAVTAVPVPETGATDDAVNSVPQGALLVFIGGVVVRRSRRRGRGSATA